MNRLFETPLLFFPASSGKPVCRLQRARDRSLSRLRNIDSALGRADLTNGSVLPSCDSRHASTEERVIVDFAASHRTLDAPLNHGRTPINFAIAFSSRRYSSGERGGGGGVFQRRDLHCGFGHRSGTRSGFVHFHECPHCMHECIFLPFRASLLG